MTETFTYTKSYSSGNTITASDFNANFNDVRSFLLATKLDEGNLQQSVGGTKLTFSIDTIQNTTEKFYFQVPSGVTLEWKEIHLGFESGTGTIEVDIEDDGSTALTGGPITSDTAAAVARHAVFVGDAAAGSLIEVSIEETENDQCDNVLVTIWAGTDVRS